jgi:hypothetical protein
MENKTVNELLMAAAPIFGMLACLFVGFLIVSESRSGGGRAGYWIFALGVVWLIASASALWPGLHDAQARDMPRVAAPHCLA